MNEPVKVGCLAKARREAMKPLTVKHIQTIEERVRCGRLRTYKTPREMLADLANILADGKLAEAQEMLLDAHHWIAESTYDEMMASVKNGT